MTVSSPPPPPQAPTPAKKGLSPLAWVGIGCGAVLVLGAIAFAGFLFFVKQQADKLSKNPVMATAEIAVKLHPDYELVAKDEEKSTLTVKNVKTGEVVTLNAADVSEGRWSVTTDKGTVEADLGTSSPGSGKIEFKDPEGRRATLEAGTGAAKAPSWMPTYPRGKAEGWFTADTPEGRSTSFSVTTSDGVKEVLDFYQRELEAAGLAAKTSSLDSDGVTVGGTVTGESSDGKRVATIVVSRSASSTQAMVNATDKP